MTRPRIAAVEASCNDEFIKTRKLMLPIPRSGSTRKATNLVGASASATRAAPRPMVAMVSRRVVGAERVDFANANTIAPTPIRLNNAPYCSFGM